MNKSFDVAVIGAGPGGYVAAIRCAQLGLSTVCIDEWKSPDGGPALGGTCLNVGCIPSKALLESSENYERIVRKLPDHGILTQGVRLDVAAMMARKDGIVKTLTDGIGLLFRKNKVERVHGHARLTGQGSPWHIEVEAEGKTQWVDARHVIIATGSTPRDLPFAPVDQERIVDNVGALGFSEVPRRLGVIGAGVIALELGSVWRRLGAEVTLLEAGSAFLPGADEQVAAEAYRVLSRQGLGIRHGVRIQGVKAGRKTVTVEFEDREGRRKQAFDRLLVAAGRVPNTAGLGAERVGLRLDEKGFIEVDAQCRTNLPDVYAIGDVVRGPMLAHKASEEGMAVAERIAGQAGHVNYDTIPLVIYTQPEIAWVGRTEQELRGAGVDYRKGVFPFVANGRAHAHGEPEGFVKMLADAGTDRILGVHVIGTGASELISEAVVAMEFAASSEDLARIVHAHPTLAEAMHEAALAVGKRAIHI
jgi:dihydrolipoamide dehydrogenase